MLIDSPIKSSRLTLRPLNETDIGERYLSWLREEEITRYLEVRFTGQTVSGLRRYVASLNDSKDTLFLGMFIEDSGVHIGNIKLGPVNFHHRRADMGIIIGDRDYWGKGLAPEAIEALAQYAFTVLGLHKLMAGMYEENEGSLQAFLKVGFAVEGRLSDHWLCDGAWQHHIQLCRLREPAPD